MSLTEKLKGVGVALVTPFLPDKSIDYDTLGRLIDFQISSGVDYIVALGTTSESPTLSEDERREVRRYIVERVGGRVPLVLGLGGYNTRALVDQLKNDDLSDFCAILSVTPYYNKPSQEGLYRHFTAVADASPVPVILYNVPGRTGTNMAPATALRLASHPNIIAVKEASGNLGQAQQIIAGAEGEDFVVLSGDDALTLGMVSAGGNGVISVIANALPAEFSEMVHAALSGDMELARRHNKRLSAFYPLLSVDGNPAGIKCLLSILGYGANELRLPLVPCTEATASRLASEAASLKK